MRSYDIKKSVLVPIIFFSWFKFPLTLKELRRYLWRGELLEEELVKTLKDIPEVHYANDQIWYGELMGDRPRPAGLAEVLWRKVNHWRWIFSVVPFISQVYVTNTLAYDNVHTNSDIDLFIVAKTGRLWTARVFLLVWLNLFKLRVRSVNRFAQFSPEFFVSDRMMNLEPLALPGDYYLSYWLADLVPIWPDGQHRLLRQANNWAKLDLPIAWRSPKLKTYRYLHSSWLRLILEKILSGKWGQHLEEWVYGKQRKIIEKNIKRIGINPSIVTTRDIIKLHFNDRRALVRDAIDQILHDFLAKTK